MKQIVTTIILMLIASCAFAQIYPTYSKPNMDSVRFKGGPGKMNIIDTAKGVLWSGTDSIDFNLGRYFYPNGIDSFRVKEITLGGTVLPNAFYRMGIYEQVDDSIITYLQYSPSDSSIRIQGDTMKAIRLVMQQYLRSDSMHNAAYDRMWELQKLVDAGIGWLNTIPDYWRTKDGSKKWAKYYALLKKNGYYMTKKKKPIY